MSLQSELIGIFQGSLEREETPAFYMFQPVKNLLAPCLPPSPIVGLWLDRGRWIYRVSGYTGWLKESEIRCATSEELLIKTPKV
jgi:hypothetical protein